MPFSSIDEDPGTGVNKKPVATVTQADGTYAQVTTEVGAASHAHGAANVTTSVAVIVAARTTRRRVTIWHRGQAGHGDVYIGASGATVGSGAFLPALPGASVVIQARGDIYAIADTNAANVSYLEEFE